MNAKHLDELVKMMYLVDSCEPLEDLGSALFDREVINSWRIYRSIVKNSKARSGEGWGWVSDHKKAFYPVIRVDDFNEFATVLFHEAAHGWCYYLRNHDYFLEERHVNEEQICWLVSRLVCRKLRIEFSEDIELLGFQMFLCRKAENWKRYESLSKKAPLHMVD